MHNNMVYKYGASEMADVPKYRKFIADQSQLKKCVYCFLIGWLFGQQILQVLK